MSELQFGTDPTRIFLKCGSVQVAFGTILLLCLWMSLQISQFYLDSQYQSAIYFNQRAASELEHIINMTRLVNHNLNLTNNGRAQAPVLTIFTSFKDEPSRLRIHSNVILNWAQFIPTVRPILYTHNTDQQLVDLANAVGWTVQNAPGVNEHGTPYFKNMYFHAAKLYPSSMYYGYCNGDLLFDSGLVDTLQLAHKFFDQLGNNTMIVGQRSNFAIRNRILYHAADITRVGGNEGVLFQTNAEDFFFIAHNKFPWEATPDLVIGRPAYDNFLVGMALDKNVSLIDATKTLLALHQTGIDGNFAGHRNKDKKVNTKAIDDSYGKFDYNKGVTSNAQYYTRYGSNRVVELWRRQIVIKEKIMKLPEPKLDESHNGDGGGKNNKTDQKGSTNSSNSAHVLPDKTDDETSSSDSDIGVTISFVSESYPLKSPSPKVADDTDHKHEVPSSHNISESLSTKLSQSVLVHGDNVHNRSDGDYPYSQLVGQLNTTGDIFRIHKELSETGELQKLHKEPIFLAQDNTKSNASVLWRNFTQRMDYEYSPKHRTVRPHLSKDSR